jgi:uncharacterized protein (TIGR03084 family)
VTTADVARTTDALDGLVADLAAEHHALDEVVADLGPSAWRTPTPSPGWTVADQIAHLTYFDRAAAAAITDPDAFAADVAALVEGALDEGLDEYTLGALRTLEPAELLASWRRARGELIRAAATLDPAARVPWYGPAMGARSFLSARLMETWAHGTDVVDALGARRAPTDRLRHVARLGANTRAWSYRVRGEEPPPGTVRVVLLAPSGATWTYGPDDADDVVEGSAEEFCLVVTQRRHLDDTALRTGALGRAWMLRAQAFAGGPSEGPPPRGARDPA